ncbi:hypothetical protein DN062_08025 [Nitrincola tibetensis]|uniref:ABC transporter substrate-binding protein n=2 Tax=Nitrincola tibetensis TaxID=2219697 RepID=A0A364NM34_9GAMM|nr:hypothetical protein DN062_08025 [Nitrincola tibetensis]
MEHVMNGYVRLKVSLKSFFMTLCILLVLCLSIIKSYAAVSVVLSEHTQTYLNVVSAMEQNSDHPVQVYAISDQTQSLASSQLFIAIGARACQSVLAAIQSHQSLFCTFLPSQAYELILQTTQASLRLSQEHLSALFLDQPLERQIHLARLIQPDAEFLGTLLGPNSHHLKPHFDAYSRKHHFTPISARLSESDNPVQELTPIIEQSDVFLSLPDNALFNRSATRWSLYIALRNKVPLIGFSASYVDAGAVIGLYSTPTQIGRQTGEVLDYFMKHKHLPPPSFPNYFSLSVNRSAARTLQINLPEIDEMLDALKTSK